MMSVPYRSHFSVQTSQFVFTFGSAFRVRGSRFAVRISGAAETGAEPNMNTKPRREHSEA
jgi:hypothetical protein